MSITTITGTSRISRRDARTGVVVILTGEGLYVRERGRKITYGPIAYGKVLLVGATQYVAEQKRLKAAEKVQRRLERQGAKARTR